MKHASPYAGLVGSLTPAELEDLSDAVGGAQAPRRDRLRHARRGGGDAPPVASLPAMRRLSGLEGRIRALGGAEVEVPGVRRQVLMCNKNRSE